MLNNLKTVLFKVRNATIAALFAATLLISQLSWLQSTAEAAPTGLPSGFSATQITNSGMGTPTSVRVAPDGRLFIFDLYGGIKIYKQGVGFNANNFGSVSVLASVDRGLLGATFDRDFANNPYLYIHYVGSDNLIRIGRFNASTDTGTGFTVIYTAPTTAGAQHAGGGITMGNDNMIYFGIGDAGTPTNSQDLTKIFGKIHRVNRDGTVPTNPFNGQAGVPNTIFAYGVRNPFRMTTDTQTGAIYVGDVGYNTWEEINLVSAGKNYGWATQEGPCTTTCAFENPVYWYPHQFGTNNTNDASIVAGPVYRGSAYPASYQGKMFVSDYVQGFIRTITPSVASNTFSTFSTGNGPVIDMDVGGDGKLYFITISSPVLYRLDYNSGNLPPVAQASSNIVGGASPLVVNFSSAGSSDPEGQPLSYSWNFGDNTTSTSANPTKTYTSNGQYTVTLTVSDGTQTTQSSAITIRVGTPPTVMIQSPVSTQKYNGGQIINYNATATASNGSAISDSNIKTTIRLFHSDHSHPFLGPITGGSGQFTTPIDGELSPDVWLRITVEATDSNGVTGSSSVDIQPNKATITVNTSPAGLNVVLDGSNHVIPPTVQGVVGMTRQIAAPSPQFYQGVQYVFDHWSDGGAQDHVISFPSNNTTYTAHYVPVNGGGTTMQNIAPNPSFENMSGLLPSSWSGNKWGTNNAMFTSSSDARTGARSARLDISSFTSGEIRLSHSAASVNPNTVHNVRYFYKSNVQTKAVADVTLQDNSHKYIWLGMNQPSDGINWREQNWTFTTPENAKNVIVNLYLVSNGYFIVDDFELLAPTSGGGSNNTAPVITFNASPSTIPAGSTSQLQWSTTGTNPVCTASGAWTGSQATSGSVAVTPVATSTYTITSTNSVGSDSKSVTVTVQNPQPPNTSNLISNPSFEQETPQHTPEGWASSKWGSNSAQFSIEHGSAYSGDHHARVQLSNYVSGDARWLFAPVTISSGQHTLSFYYKGNGSNKAMVEITLQNGTKQYIWLGQLPNATNWTKFTKTFVAPTGSTRIVGGVYLYSNGSMETDEYSLVTGDGSTAPTVVAPTVTLSASPGTILNGGTSLLSWNVSGTLPTCTASGAWTGSQTTNGSTVVSPVTTSTYTLTCTNSVGTDSKSVVVEVGTTNPLLNMITNGSLATSIDGVEPQGWYRGSWGNNITTATYETTGRTDSRSVSVTIQDRVDGDAKWIFDAVSVNSGASYSYSHWYMSTVETELVYEYTMANGSKSYDWQGFIAPASNWTQINKSITIPPDVAKITVLHIIKSNGTLKTDDFQLTAN